MKDAWSGKPVVGQFGHPIPREAVLLAAPPERSTPEVDHVMPERRERPTICGYRIVRKMACNDLLQPVTLIWDSLVHSQPQLRLDFLELRLHAVAPGLPLKLEESPARFTADEGEAQKREGVRSADGSSRRHCPGARRWRLSATALNLWMVSASQAIAHAVAACPSSRAETAPRSPRRQRTGRRSSPHCQN